MQPALYRCDTRELSGAKQQEGHLQRGARLVSKAVMLLCGDGNGSSCQGGLNYEFPLVHSAGKTEDDTG